MGALYACWENFMQTPRQQGHLGICIMHFAFDRGCNKPLSALIKRRLLQMAPGHGVNVPGVTPLTLNWTEWVVVTPCSLHDLQNAFRWGMHA
eukprot:9244068-Lingulodinium_polyedra.AAC.1